MKISLKERYNENIQQIKDELSIDNPNALPHLQKVTINVGTGRMRDNKDMLTYIEGAIKQITGQKPVITTAKKSVAGFKLREGEKIGMKVTLRGQRMYDFLDRLINVYLPRIRDFRGFDIKNFDPHGNLTIGLRDSMPFAELGHSSLDKPFGMSITLTINGSDKEKSAKLLKVLGLPMKLD